MKQFFNIFKFEFGAYFKNKVFISVTAVIVLVVGVVLFFPRLSGAFKTDGNSSGDKQAVFVIDDVSENPQLTLSLFQSAMTDNDVKLVKSDIDDVKAQVDSEECEFAVALTGENKYTYIVKNGGLYDQNISVIDEIMQTKYRLESMNKLGISYKEASGILTAPAESETVLTGKDQSQSFFYTYILIFGLYMAILLYGQFVATSVASEKSSRAMELLITSAKPTNLMFGKVLGTGCAGLFQLVVILGTSFICFNLNKEYWEGNAIVNSIFNMPAAILGYTVLFFVLGYFIYSFLYGAVGSLVSKVEDLNTSIMPINFIFIIAFVIIMIALGSGEIDTPLIIALSYFPLTSPMAMFLRIAMSEPNLFEIAASVAILIASTIGIGYLSAKIYQAGVLMYGKAPKLSNVIKSLKFKR